MIKQMLNARLLFTVLAIAAVGQLHAATFSFSTPNGAEDPAKNPVAASAIFVVSGNTITITLENTEANPIDDGQVLDAMTFQLANQTIPNGATISMSMTESEFVDVGSTGAYTQVTTNLPSWSLTDSVSGSNIDFDICNYKETGMNCTSAGSEAPEGGIIGAAGANNKYTNANTTIKGGPANPYIYDEATITIKLSSGTFTTNGASYSDVLFGFGSNVADDIPVPAAPEPSTFLMMGLLGVGLAAFQYRHKLALKR
jgi:hypothetical protein